MVAPSSLAVAALFLTFSTFSFPPSRALICYFCSSRPDFPIERDEACEKGPINGTKEAKSEQGQDEAKPDPSTGSTPPITNPDDEYSKKKLLEQERRAVKEQTLKELLKTEEEKEAHRKNPDHRPDTMGPVCQTEWIEAANMIERNSYRSSTLSPWLFKREHRCFTNTNTNYCFCAWDLCNKEPNLEKLKIVKHNEAVAVNAAVTTRPYYVTLPMGMSFVKYKTVQLSFLLLLLLGISV